MSNFIIIIFIIIIIIIIIIKALFFSFCLFFLLSQSDLFSILIVCVDGYSCTWSQSWPTHTHTHTYIHLVILLWMRDRPVAETSTWQHTLLTTDRHPCFRRDSNPQSKQASGRRATPYWCSVLTIPEATYQLTPGSHGGIPPSLHKCNIADPFLY